MLRPQTCNCSPPKCTLKDQPCQGVSRRRSLLGPQLDPCCPNLFCGYLADTCANLPGPPSAVGASIISEETIVVYIGPPTDTGGTNIRE